MKLFFVTLLTFFTVLPTAFGETIYDRPNVPEADLAALGAELEPANSNVWAYTMPDYLFLRKAGATINYQTPHQISWDVFHLAVHVGGNTGEHRVPREIERLAQDLKTKEIPSVLLDRYQNNLNRTYFDLEVNDYNSGGGYHSMSLSSSQPKLIISGAYLDGCVSNALSHFLAQMEAKEQSNMEIYVVREMTTPFCELGREQSLQVQEHIEDLNQCMNHPLISSFGEVPFLSLMIDAVSRDVQRLRENHVSETLIPEALRPSENNDIGYSFRFNGELTMVSTGERQVTFHFVSRDELFQQLGLD